MLEIIKIGGGRLNLTLNLEINGWLNQVVFILIFKQTFLRKSFQIPSRSKPFEFWKYAF